MSGVATRARRKAMGVALVLACWAGAAPAAAQLSSVDVMLPGGERTTLAVEAPLGYPAVSADQLAALDWSVEEGPEAGHVVLRHRTGIELDLMPGSPIVQWNDRLLQMVDAAFREGDTFFVPLQLVIDVLPGFLPRAYAFDEESRTLRVEGAVDGPAEPPPEQADAGDPPAPDVADRPTPDAEPDTSPEPAPPAGQAQVADEDGPEQPEPFSLGGDRGGERLVVIDPGHGGEDPGAIGPGGRQEKDIALAVSLALARELARRPGIEVRLTRDRDVAVPLWTRGKWATEWKGDRPGAFVSIHVNALPDRAGVRGFETYFLSEARTEHEQRVAAAENASLEQDAERTQGAADPFLDTILRDLRMFDHQQWSALLADDVQRELSSFHPGPDRGVKQGPLAVITNSLMPSVLVEVGFITNPEEERLMIRPDFQRETAEAIARALDRFFERYPP